MTPLRKIAVIGNSLPRRCGIATFSTDLQRAISNSRPNLQTCIVAMTDHGQTYDYPASVALQIKDDSIEEYVGAAAFLNAGRFDIVCLQHEFGIFGGEAGAHILELLSRLTMPVVTTLHTVLAAPTAAQRAVMERIIEVSVEGRRDGQQGPRTAAQRLSRAGRQDRGHRPRHPRLSVCRAGRGKGQTRISATGR